MIIRILKIKILILIIVEINNPYQVNNNANLIDFVSGGQSNNNNNINTGNINLL